MPGDVVDVLLGVDRRDLAAELLEALDDPDGGVAVAGVVRGSEPGRARAEDGDVDDAVLAHGAEMLLAPRQKASPGPEPSSASSREPQPAAPSGASSPSSTWKEWPQPHAAETFGLLIAKPGLEALDPVDLGAGQVGSAERVDDDGDAVALELVVALLGAPVEAERVLEARAAAALDGDAQDRGLALGLLGHQVANLRRRALGERDECQLVLGGRHRAHRSSVYRLSESPSRALSKGRVCNNRLTLG